MERAFSNNGYSLHYANSTRCECDRLSATLLNGDDWITLGDFSKTIERIGNQIKLLTLSKLYAILRGRCTFVAVKDIAS